MGESASYVMDAREFLRHNIEEDKPIKNIFQTFYSELNLHRDNPKIKIY